jgi:hypothetical protein
MTTSERFWPTPSANEMRTMDAERLLERRAACKAKHGNGNGFGLTLGNAITLEEAGLTSSPEASPASPGLPLESSRARQMTATSGLNCIDLWFPSGPVGGFLRTCLASSVWRVALTGYSLTWKRAATPQGRSLYRLRLSGPTTAAIESGLWPTPSESDTQGSRTLPEGTTATGQRPDGKKAQVGLPNAVMMWATPRVEGFDAGKHRGKADSLHSQVKMLPTPRAIYGEHPDMTDPKHLTGAAMLPTAAASDWKGSSEEGQRRGQLSEVVAGMKLSAAWVCALMGYPPGYLDDLPSDPIGSPASPASRRTKKTV